MRQFFVALLLGAAACAAGAAPAHLSVCLYYDGDDNAPDFRVGERSAVMVRNLLGHFKEVNVRMEPVGAYTSRALSQCDRAMYMGTYFNARMPEAFLSEVAQYRKPF